jgi:hypothetical protein
MQVIIQQLYEDQPEQPLETMLTTLRAYNQPIGNNHS